VIENQTPHFKITARYKKRKWPQGTPLDWAQETLWLMRTPAAGYLGNPSGLIFDEVYVQQNYPIAQEQIEKAGVRLDTVLNQALATQGTRSLPPVVVPP
jgi:hypothetical protein